MFTDEERQIIVARLMMILEQQKAGKAADRKALAELMADDVREFLAPRYDTNFGANHKPKGMFQTRDTLDKDDFPK